MSRSHKTTIYDVLKRHPVHPFPARMAPDIAIKILSVRGRLRVLDPMMGSGTVLALARANGHQAFGVDIDPLSVLTTTVWITPVDRVEARRKALQVLDRAKKAFKTLSARQAYPLNTDRETRKFIRYWFDLYSRRQLSALANSIRKVRNEATRNVLWCAFSKLIITKQAGASLAMDLSHSRPHKSYETSPIKPFTRFLGAVESVLENCISSSAKNRGPAPTIKSGDARKLALRDNSIDLVLTSPPYLNAIDYMRCSKFSLVWMGITTERIRDIRCQSIGCEVGKYESSDLAQAIIKRLRLESRLTRRHKAILVRFVEDMYSAIREVFRVLTPGGKAVYVVGENTIRGTYIKNSEIIMAIASEVGLELSAQQSRALPPNRRYLPPPSSRIRRGSLNARMRREVILSFRKRARRKTQIRTRKRAA